MVTDIQKVSILHKDSIHCGFHLVPYIAETVLGALPASTYVLITDTNIAALHLGKFEQEFKRKLPEARRFLTHVIPPGETSKSREGKADIEDFLLSHACTRDTVILALGGGVIGDLVGFVAATFMRGVRFVQIPTTLLAMVDSSVGGKTAIDTPHGKNLIGAFWQPEFIFIDVAFLETLPAREFSNGMAEVIKTAAIWDEGDFSLLESRSKEIFTAVQTPSQNFAGRQRSTRSESQELLLKVIVGSISVKSHIVTVDERETGLRNLVNYGHSIGHALEAVLTPAILHGECVSIGAILEAEISRRLGHLGQVAVGRLARVFQAYNLPVSTKDPRITAVPASKSLSVDRLLDIMKIDKKNQGSTKKIVLLARIGKTVEERASAVADDVIRYTLSEAVRVIPSIPGHVRMATPGSKSISNRALVLAALGRGTCRLKNLLHSDDTQVMMAALTDLKGARFFWEDNGETLVVEGGGGTLQAPQNDKEIYLGNAGTAARFLTTVCTLVAPTTGSSNRTTTITGNARMKQRPIGPLVDALRANGSSVAYRESEGCLPLAIGPGFRGGHVQLAASVSSQYVSSILLCAPYAKEDVVLELVGGRVISQPYIDMTIAMMRVFGVDVKKDAGKDVYRIKKGTYTNPLEYAIESDASSATYPLAIAAITGTTCTVQNIGSSSLQGDARFAMDVLRPMGCTVVQSENETTVTGPSIHDGLRAVGTIDMQPMTDAFLTASVLAAVARRPSGAEGKRTTRILGIANQRVKECNRIKAMIDQLAKFGVETTELEDGLEIYGRNAEELKTGVSVHCYDDHRVAMAFSVLATKINGTILEEKRCVEKTWPNWWDDLQTKIGIPVEGVQLETPSGSARPNAYDKSASVLLIGMRGAGKSYIGKLAAAALDREFVDADVVFEEKFATGVKEYVHKHGWEAFRAGELEVLRELLRTKSREHIISLGGGIVESPAARDILKTYMREEGPVVYIARDVNEIVKYLGEESLRPSYGEPVLDVYQRREPWFTECSSHEFINYTGILQASQLVLNALDSPWSPSPSAFKTIQRFFRHITGVAPNFCPKLEDGRRSYFLSLTYPDVSSAVPILEELTEGSDAIELRVDLLSPSGPLGTSPNIPPLSYVANQVAILRRHTPLPLIFTVRTVSQGGMFPDSADDAAFDLMMLGIRFGCEYIDVEIAWPEKHRLALNAMKGNSRIISSWHDWSGNMKWDSAYLKEKYTIAAKLGDIVKIVGKADKMEDNFTLRKFVASVTGPEFKPLIAINMSSDGQISRILNGTFSPVTHPLLPNKAAPGQLSVAQIQTALHLLGQLPVKKFYLFGKPIAESMSPTLHNTGFRTLGLPHGYELLETGSVDDEIRAVLQSQDFGGASVTIPLKLDILPLLDIISPEAKAIGAVNTIVARLKADGSRELYGDNTDWVGIAKCVRENLRDRPPRHLKGLVIGGGGTARAALYSLHAMGVGTIYLFNRTRGVAEKLVAELPSNYNIRVLDAVEKFTQGAPSIIISTVPASALCLEPTEGKIFLSGTLLSATEGGVVVDMAYRPAVTPLLSLAQSIQDVEWRTVQGVGVLLEQGYRQFEAWTGMRAPRSTIKRAVHQRYEGN